MGGLTGNFLVDESYQDYIYLASAISGQSVSVVPLNRNTKDSPAGKSCMYPKGYEGSCVLSQN